MYRQFTTQGGRGTQNRSDKHLQDDLAGGRVFTGRVAVDNKLVDKLGTLDDAIAEAKSLAGLKADEPIDRLNLPKPKTFFDRFFGDDMDTERTSKSNCRPSCGRWRMAYARRCCSAGPSRNRRQR